MDYKYIDQLLERYWQCLTTLEEERILRAFFEQEDVPAHLLQWREWFVYPQAELQEQGLGDDFEERLRPLTRAAAVVAIVLTLGNAIQISLDKPRSNKDSNEEGITENATMAKNDSILTDSAKQVPFTEVIRTWNNDAHRLQIQ